MEYIVPVLGFLILLIILKVIVSIVQGVMPNARTSGKSGPVYIYAPKEVIMTEAEAKFFHRLQSVAADRYLVFPQIHLSALMVNKTAGKYWKAGFQRLQRRSVDYVLCDKSTLRSVYAVELDDSTHDSRKRQARDSIVEHMLSGVGLPLVRFRNVSQMSDDDIAKRFEEAAHLVRPL